MWWSPRSTYMRVEEFSCVPDIKVLPYLMWSPHNLLYQNIFKFEVTFLKAKFNVPLKSYYKKINSSFKFNYTQYLIKLKLFKIIKISQFSFKEIIINCHQLIEILLIWIFFLKSTEFMWKKYNPFILTSIFSVLPSSTLSLLKFIKYPCK